MRYVRFILIATLLLGTLSCKQSNVTATPEGQAELLTTTNWRLTQITDAQGNPIPTNRMGAQAAVLLSLDFQFTNNNIARAINQNTKQIVNGGTWYFTSTNDALDVNVTGFQGIFPIIILTRSRLILRQTTKVDGQDAPVNLEFVPVV